MNSLSRCCIAALVGGAFGAAVWAGITYATGMEIGWIAWGVGLCVGIAVRIGAGDDADGFIPGGIAVTGAILALLVGKYVAVHCLVQHELNDYSVVVTAEDMQGSMADEVAAEWMEAGQKLRWSPGMTYEQAESLADYPPGVRAEAVKQWEALSDEEQQQQIANREEAMKMFTDMMSGQLTEAAFKESFSPIDLLFFGLAIFTAFKVGSGMVEE